MKEQPTFEGPLRNPDVSEEADRELDRAMDRMPAAIARSKVPEFAAIEDLDRPDQHIQKDPPEPTKKSSRPKRTRRGLGHMGLSNADEPPPHIPDARRLRTG